MNEDIMSNRILGIGKSLQEVSEKYPQKERGERALSYHIYTELAKRLGYSFRMRMILLKGVRKKINGVK
jgi:hypothetical protein